MSFVRKWVSNYWQVIHASWWTPLELFESNLLEGDGSIGGRIRFLHITFIHARSLGLEQNLTCNMYFADLSCNLSSRKSANEDSLHAMLV